MKRIAIDDLGLDAEQHDQVKQAREFTELLEASGMERARYRLATPRSGHARSHAHRRGAQAEDGHHRIRRA